MSSCNYRKNFPILTGPWSVSSSSFYFNTITSIAMSSNGKKVAICSYNGLYLSTDSGSTFTKTTFTIASYVTCSSDGTKLAATVNSRYIYTSSDSGSTWTNSNFSVVGNWLSITSSSNGTRLAACFDNNSIYVSADSGSTWTKTSAPSANWQCITSSSDGTKLAACEYYGYIHVSTNSGGAWTQTIVPINAWGCITSSSDGTKLAAVVKNEYIYISSNSGGAWTSTNTTVYSFNCITSSPDGNTLVAGGGYISVSTNFGSTWSNNLYPSANYISIALSSDGTNIIVGRDNGYIYTPSTTTPTYPSLETIIKPIQTTPSSFTTFTLNKPSTNIYTISVSNLTGLTCSSTGQYVYGCVQGLGGGNAGGAWVSSNYGKTFTIASNVPQLFTSQIACSYTGQYAICVTGNQNNTPASGYIYVSTNYGVNWSVPGGTSSLYYRGASMDSTGQYMVACSTFYTSGTCNIYISTNYGSSWSTLYTTTSIPWENLYMNSSGKYIVAYSTNWGQGPQYIMYSSNMGSTWTTTGNISSVQFNHPNCMNSMYISYSGQYWVYNKFNIGFGYSTDYGNTFTLIKPDGINGFAVSTSGKNIVYQSSTSNTVLYVSNNYGLSFNQITIPAYTTYIKVTCMSDYGIFYSNNSTNLLAIDFAYDFGDYFECVQTVPAVLTNFNAYGTNIWTPSTASQNWGQITANASGKYVAATVTGGNIWTSTDYGSSTSWIQTNSPSYNWTGISTNSSGLMITASTNVAKGNIWISGNAGVSWLGNTSPSIGWNGVAVNGTGQYIVGAPVFGNLYVSSNFGTTWANVSSGSKSWSSVASSNSGQWMMATASTGIFDSSNNGNTWVSAYTDGNVVSWGQVCISNSGQYAAAVPASTITGNIYVSNNFGSSWFIGNASLTSTPYKTQWSSVATSATGQFMAAATTAGNVYQSTNYGVNWKLTNAPNIGWTGIAMNYPGNYINICTPNNIILPNTGATIDIIGSYIVFSFKGTSGSITCNNPNITQFYYLVVGGGGNGGNNNTGRYGGGGGGGGVLQGSFTLNTNDIITISVGGATQNSSISFVNNTSLNKTAIAGGNGGNFGHPNGYDGGGGGGVYGDTSSSVVKAYGTAGLGTSGQGYNGGRGWAAPDVAIAGGGGGAGQAGGYATYYTGGAKGGDGVTCTQPGISSIYTGYFGGGGGGSYWKNDIIDRVGGAGGRGGGRGGGSRNGYGSSDTSTNNSGGGGGGAGLNTTANMSGWSGIVVIAYISKKPICNYSQTMDLGYLFQST